MSANRSKYSIIGVLVIFAMWSCITYGGFINRILLPPPHEVLVLSIKEIFVSGVLLKPIFETLLQWFTAFLLGGLSGAILGILAGYLDKLYDSFEIVIDFFRSLPSLLLVPIAIIFLGIGNITAIFVTGWVSFFYTFISAVYGVRYSRKSYILVTKLLDMGSYDAFTEVILPASLPSIVAGMRLASSVALIVTIGTQMILGRGGLGGRVYDAFQCYDTVEVYAIVVIVGTLGYLTNKMIVFVETKTIHWRGA